MLRRRVMWGLLLVLSGAACAAGTFLWGLRSVPDFYQEALSRQPDPTARQKSADRFVKRTLSLVEQIQYSENWSEEFHQDQVNAFLAEELHAKYPELAPPGVQDPRVALADGLVRIGFRYDEQRFGGIVSLELRPWVPEPNQLAVEVRSVKVGLVPVPLEQVIDEVTRQFETHGWRVEWNQADGNDVLLVHLDGEDPERPVLEHIAVEDGRLEISGSRLAGGTGEQGLHRVLHGPSAGNQPNAR